MPSAVSALQSRFPGYAIGTIVRTTMPVIRPRAAQQGVAADEAGVAAWTRLDTHPCACVQVARILRDAAIMLAQLGAGLAAEPPVR